MHYENKIIENIKYEDEFFEDLEYADCEFRKCTMEDCTFTRIIFNECKFIDCTIVSPKIRDVQMKFAEFQKCNLIGVHWNNLLSPGRIFEPIRKIVDCFMKYNTFINMNFIQFDFGNNIIQESSFEECNLKDSSFKNCQLNGTHYTSCNLQKADFRNTNGYVIDIMNNRMKGAKFSFPDAINLLDSLEIKID